MEQKDVAKIAAAVTAIWAAYRNAVPDEIQNTINVVALFIALDTLTGLWAATICCHVASRRLIEKLVTKCAQYALLLGLAGGAALLAHNWTIVQGGLLAIVGVEALSMLENLARLEKHGGVNLGPARPLLQRLSRYLAVTQEEDGKGKGDV
ncbi:MAG TPA: phage holin family protein [Chthonomonadaceae bacterium]|nr:phage holin family protein [Chthonomonadaceae bacterium]